ncbi:MAG: serine dehydratase [Candidatus Melainabacteria bacterium HGW-Melainabacteria-1]|nr:MAG: serine dehydratase [Candidatus Melainabacteria bacterium HGW-Melainabacteria-1]
MQPSPYLYREGLLAAREQLAGQVHRTPVLQSQSLNRICGAELHFKCENFQKVGAFKYRGAMHALGSLNPVERSRGVVTHSSGNHAQALALAAQHYGVPAWIVMPENAPRIKQAAVAGYGAEIILCEATLAAREASAAEVRTRTGAVFIHPYDDPRIIAGQATAAMELLDQADLEIVLAPVGGGGLLSGTALAVNFFAGNVATYGAEPAGADDAARSLQTGQIQPSLNPNTIADGLLTSLGEWTFPIIQQHVKQILTVSEDGILAALRLIYERLKIVVEPSGAVPLAAVLEHPQRFAGRRVGLILSGGNVDLAQLGTWMRGTL